MLDTSPDDYQKTLRIVEGADAPVIRVPLVMQPREPAKSKTEMLQTIAEIAAQPPEMCEQSELCKLLDFNGGVIHLKRLPLKPPEDFSDFLVAMAGKGEHAWTPHVDVGMEALRRPRAKRPPSHFICWHNEYAVSSGHHEHLVLFCMVLREGRPDPRARLEVVGGNGFYKASAFGPTHGLAAPDSEEAKRKGVERRVLQLAGHGGWHTSIGKSGESIPAWQRRGFGFAGK
ncbi:hypothetical protein DL765_009429 [Monosporascus sp. GIB2]|nr:hypothetical protein DL765_009429 [Monosporascus sp. GIB2]